MSLKNLPIDPETHKIEIDIMEQKPAFAIVVCDGKAKLTELPAFGGRKLLHIKERSSMLSLMKVKSSRRDCF